MCLTDSWQIIMISLSAHKKLKEFDAALISLEAGWFRVSQSSLVETEKERDICALRELDLKWLQSAMHKYRDAFHNTRQSAEFWQGCEEGKSCRRTLYCESRIVLNLIKKAVGNQADSPQYLGLQVGWRYARVKGYIQRNLEQLAQDKKNIELVTFG